MSEADLAAALRDRQDKRQEHAKQGRSSMVGGDYRAASLNFTAAIALTVARSHADVMALAHSDRWKPKDPKRVELDQLYSGRALAYIKEEAWVPAIKDAHASCLLAPNAQPSLSLFAAAAAGLCRGPQEPLSFFLADEVIDAADSPEVGASFAAEATSMLCHGLVADVHSIMMTNLEEDSPQYNEAVSLRDSHVTQSHGNVHPLAVRGGLSDDQAYQSMTMAIESVAHETIHRQTDDENPKAAVLAQHLISLVAFRYGCRNEPPLDWRPNYLQKSLAEDRIIDVWLRWRLYDDSTDTGTTARLAVGQQVRLTGLETRPDLNGKQGEVGKYNAVKDRYSVLVDGRRLRLKKANLEVIAATDGDALDEYNSKDEV